MRIHDPDERPLALAGLWTGRQDPESGIWHRTFTIVTTTPNEFMASDPQPDAGRGAAGGLDALAVVDDGPRGRCDRCSSRRDAWALDAYPVPPLVNNVRNNGPELVERLQPPPEPLTLL